MTTIPFPKDAKITDEAILENALRFAFGNARMENEHITRQMINAAVDAAMQRLETLPTVAQLGG